MSSGSSDSSGTSTGASDETSSTTDTGQIEPGIKVIVKDNSGNVVVARRSAKIHLRKTKGGKNHDSPIASSSTTQSQDPLNGTSPADVIQNSEYIPGTYCQRERYKPQYGERERRWNPRPDNGILINKGDKELQWSIESFMDNPDQFIQEMDISVGLRKEQREQFIIHVLKHLEKSWGRCSSSNDEVYKILGKISCSVNSGTVVRHALRLLFYLICKDHFDNGNRNLLVIEAISRSSIFSSEGMFKKDQHSEQNLKLLVYSRILSLLLAQHVRRETLSIEALGPYLKKAQEELRGCCVQIRNKKKDVFRYSMEFILKVISCLLKPHHKLIKISGFLDECQEFCVNPRIESKELKILKTLGKKNNVDAMKRGEWSDLHCIFIYLHGKVHSERPAPQMDTERRAMNLIRLIVEAYLQGGGGADWRFCLLASTILVDIAKNNVTEEIMKEAGCCLVNLLKDVKVQKRPECIALLEQRSSELLFCPDSKTRTLLVHFLSKNQNVQDALPIELHVDHLTSIYRTQTLEIDTDPTIYGKEYVIKEGMFQSRKVAVKILPVKRQHLLEEEHKFQSRERLIREAYSLKRLNASQHRNLPVLLGYDTRNFPYHIITVYETYGDLLHFVQRSRTRIHHLQPIQLLKMLIDVSDALLYLKVLDLVHRAVMAENVLVGDSNVCKIRGLNALKPLTCGTSKEGVESASLYDYCSADDGVPEFVSADNEEDLPVRWKAPECLTENRYSTASDVWAFGVLMYEVLTYGCIPYRHVLDDDEVSSRVLNGKEILPPEPCFEFKEYELIEQCCEWQLTKRISLPEVSDRLKEMLENADEDESRPDPPPLEMLQSVAGSSDFENQEELVYSSIPDHIDEDNLQVGDRPFSKTYEGFTVICERISGGDIQHMRGLLSLKNPCLASISQLHRLESPCMVVEIISPATLFGNLKEYVLNRRCQQEEIVAYLSQVASALHQLHTKHIVHGDLRAVYVNVAAPDKVQVGRLGRSSTLSMSEYDVTSTSCVKRADMPPDSIRWSAPEVILDGLYTHASDVWAFGILAWELYTSFTTGQDGRDFSTPYFGLQDDMILPYMRNERPLDQPEGCPDWVYNIMHQCWAYDSVQRPPFLAILDCLTSREPMESWIMKLWLQNHHESEWPDLSIRQTDAYHVTDTDKHPTRENIEKMCSADFFIKHHYKYVDTSSVHVEDDEYDASCSSRESTLERSQGYHEPCIDRSVKMKKPVKGDECRGSKITHYTSADVPLCKTYHDIKGLSRSATTSEALSEANDEATSRSYPEVMQEGYEELPASMSNETSDHLCSLQKEGAESGESVVTKPQSYNENAARLGTRSELLSASNEDPSGCSYPEVMEQEFDEPTTPVYNGTPSYTSAERNGKKCNKNDFMKPHSCSEETDLHRRSMKGREELSASNDEELLESVTELTFDDRELFSPESQEDATDTLFYSSVDVPECKGSHETRRLSGNKHTASYGRSVRRNEALSTCYDATSGYSHPEEESPAPMFHDTSGYLCPVEQRGDEGNDTKCLPCKDLTSDGLHYSSVDVQRSTRSHSSNGHQYNEDITPPKRSVRKSKPPSTSNDNTSCHSQPEKMEEDYETPMALMHNGTSGFPDPVKMEGDISNDNKHHPLDDISSNSLHYTSAHVVGCNETCEADHSSKTRNEVSYSELTLKKKCSIQYQTLTINLDSNDSSQRKNNTRLTEHQNAIKLDDDDSSSYDDVIECITEDRTHFEELSKDDTRLSEYQNTACKLNDDDNYDDVIGFITEDRTRFEEFSKNEYQNMECKLDEDDNYDDVIGFLTQDNTHLVEFSADNTSIGEYQNMTCKLDKLQRNTEDNPQHGEYQNMANKLDQGDFSIYDKPQQSTEDNTHLVEYQNAACALDQGDTSMYDKRNTEDNPQHGEYLNMAYKLDQDDFSIYDKPQQSTEDNTHLVEYQTTACALDRGDSSMYDDANLAEYESMACAMDHDDSSVNDKRQRHTEENILLDEYQNMSCKLNKSVRSLEEKGKTQFKHQRLVCAYQNSAHHRTFPFGVLSKGVRKNTPGSQATKKRKSHLGKNKENVHENSGLHHVHVPRGEHVYANVRTAVEGSNSSTKGALQDHSFLDKLNDPDLDTIYF